MEAKSDKSTSSFNDIDMQTAFAIRELVLLQEELRRSASALGHIEWEAAPLVWYFSYRGEQWRLHGAFPNPHKGTGAVDVVRLWSGEIDSARGALQLLLLVDYICDWGRDKFRESTIRSLAALSQSNRQGTVVSEIFSLRAATTTPVPAPRSETMGRMTATTQKIHQTGTTWQGDGKPDRYLGPDEEREIVGLTSLRQPVRDIRYIISRSKGILITKENLDLLRQSSSSKKRFSKFANDILLLIIRWGFETTSQGLDLAQMHWHKGGSTLHLDRIRHKDTKFIATISCASYISISWRLVRELYWFAIEKSALPFLEATAMAGLRCRKKVSPSRLISITFLKLNASQYLYLYTKTCARMNAAACLMRAYVVFKPDPTTNGFQVERLDASAEEPASYGHGDFPSVSSYGSHPGAVVTQLLSDNEKERLKPSPTLIHQRGSTDTVPHVNSKGDWQRDQLRVLWRCRPCRFEESILNIGSPILVVDPYGTDPETGLPQHCTFVVEQGRPKDPRRHFKGMHKTCFVAERVLNRRMQSWIGPRDLGDMLEQQLGDIWLVQFTRWNAKKSTVEEEEQVEDASDESAASATPAGTGTIVAPAERLGEVANWAQGVSNEVVIIEDSDDDIDTERASNESAASPGSSSSGSGRGSSSGSSSGSSRGRGDKEASVSTKRKRQDGPASGLGGGNREDQKESGEEGSRPRKRAHATHSGPYSAQ
ncbi:uncharacterized protein DNG_08050 [Cephalotrichum gorgonifer]|uniref:Uncharacterized protein n=1 Tax=Cephalotrichum gorgonifer TaxID=2041049 RepID=A0AAE8N5C0_9PEZI|nr:uncharacterized protein DNG_08050 [Cephalotrichum gorgonifer]